MPGPRVQTQSEMKLPWLEQGAKVRSLAIPDSEAQRRPEAGKAGAKAQNGCMMRRSTPEGKAHFET